MKKTKEQLKQEVKEWRNSLIDQAKTMVSRVPKHYWIPSKQCFLTAGQEAIVFAMVRKAYNQNPAIEFKESFQAWWPKTAKEIIEGEIWPAIHDRINARVFIPNLG